MKGIDSNSVDLTVTSPPYDNIRTYGGHTFCFKEIAEELFRVTKEGAVIVWIVGDQTLKGNETGTSFRQALYFKDIGFNLHDTMIYAKGGQGAVGSNLAYWQEFEYMFVFSKGRIKTFHPIKDRKNVSIVRNKKEKGYMGHRTKNGTKKGTREILRTEYGKRFNIWKFHECKTRTEHPAVFPQKLAEDHIISWSNKGDIVLDPMCGSGTTLIAAKMLSRQYIGIEREKEYVEIARKRVSAVPASLSSL
jgi:site-specific DNA-methyltransferase (adenine-specific)